MNRADLQDLAAERARDAEILLQAGQWSGAYYLAGYAVECGLKACIAKLTNQYDFPDKENALKCYTHKAEPLIAVAGLQVLLQNTLAASKDFANNWVVVKDWNEQARYRRWAESQAREMVTAVTDSNHGVLPWIMARW